MAFRFHQRIHQFPGFKSKRAQALTCARPAKSQDDIEPLDVRATAANSFAQDASQQISVDCAAQLLRRNDEADASWRSHRACRNHLEMPPVDAPAQPKYLRKRRGAAKAIAAARAYRSVRCDCGLDGKPAASLAATRIEDFSPSGSLHAGTESVRSLAPDNRRLIGAFHGADLFEKALN